jgi:hypothetical protein
VSEVAKGLRSRAKVKKKRAYMTKEDKRDVQIAFWVAVFMFFCGFVFRGCIPI